MGKKIRRKIQSVCVREEVKAERIGRTDDGVEHGA